MFLSAIKEIYTESGKQFLASWMKLLAWNGIWALFCVIGVLIFSNRIVQMMMGVNTDPGSVALFVFIIILISAIVWVFGFYSQLGIAHETEQDPDCSWGLCGIQGILHPRKSLGISVVSLVLSFIFTLGVTGLAFLLPVMGGVVIIFYILLFAGWAFLLMFVSMACFAQLENDESAPLASFQRAMDILKGHALKTFAFIVPVFLVCMLLLGSCASLWVGSQSGKLFDLQLAMDARQVVAAEQAKTDMERKYSIFNKKAPIYEGDFDKYVHEMAKYTVLYEEYQAKIEKRQMNDWARKFSDDHPVDQPVKKMFSILLGCLGVGGFAFWSVLLLQVFRRRTVEYEEYMEEHKFEFEETEEDKKKMEMLKEHLKTDDKSKGAKNANNVPEAPKELIMKKRAPSAALEIDTGASFNMNNMNVDNLGADNAGANDLGANTMGEAQAPIAPQEHEFVFDAEKKNQSIDMNFSLDVDALAQTLEAETGGEGKRRKRAHNSILEYYDDLAAAKKEEPIFEEGAGSLSSTLESLLDGFSKDDIK